MRTLFSVAATALIVSAGCSPKDTASNPLSPEKTALTRLTTEHLPTAVWIHAKVISGGLPEGEDGFRELQTLGVKTVISVDGAKPDVELARKYGLRYVHMPHGYDGIPDQRVVELAKAVRDLDGPIYIHCHHGKHRSPAAAAVACVGSGLIPSSEATAILRLAGTSENYRGLYQSAASAQRFENELLDRLQVEFRETVEIPPIAEAMVAMEHTFDRLKVIKDARWKQPPAHPDLEPAHEALILREHFTELLRTDEVQQQPEPFQQHLADSEHAAGELENSLRQWKQQGHPTPLPESISSAFMRIDNQCKACHAQYRDIPLNEKGNSGR